VGVAPAAPLVAVAEVFEAGEVAFAGDAIPEVEAGLPIPGGAEEGDAVGEKVSKPVGLVVKEGNPRLQPAEGIHSRTVQTMSLRTFG